MRNKKSKKKPSRFLLASRFLTPSSKVWDSKQDKKTRIIQPISSHWIRVCDKNYCTIGLLLPRTPASCNSHSFLAPSPPTPAPPLALTHQLDSCSSRRVRSLASQFEIIIQGLRQTCQIQDKPFKSDQQHPTASGTFQLEALLRKLIIKLFVWVSKPLASLPALPQIFSITTRTVCPLAGTI